MRVSYAAFFCGCADFFTPLILAQRALCAAAILLRAAALTCLVAAVEVPVFLDFNFAHLALCAAAILLLPAALIVLRPPRFETVLPEPLLVCVPPRLPAPSRPSNARIASS